MPHSRKCVRQLFRKIPVVFQIKYQRAFIVVFREKSVFGNVLEFIYFLFIVFDFWARLVALKPMARPSRLAKPVRNIPDFDSYFVFRSGFLFYIP